MKPKVNEYLNHLKELNERLPTKVQLPIPNNSVYGENVQQQLWEKQLQEEEEYYYHNGGGDSGDSFESATQATGWVALSLTIKPLEDDKFTLKDNNNNVWSYEYDCDGAFGSDFNILCNGTQSSITDSVTVIRNNTVNTINNSGKFTAIYDSVTKHIVVTQLVGGASGNHSSGIVIGTNNGGALTTGNTFSGGTN